MTKERDVTPSPLLPSPKRSRFGFAQAGRGGGTGRGPPPPRFYQQKAPMVDA